MTRLTRVLTTSALALGFAALASSPGLAGPGPECVDSTSSQGTECGTNSSAATDATAVGFGATASGDASTAVGEASSATGLFAVAIGKASFAGADNATAVGTLAMATGVGSTAIGTGAIAEGENSVAIGINANAIAPNSVALGADSVANQANTISVGSVGNERRIVNVAAGTAPTDAVNFGQFTTANNAVAGQITAIQAVNTTQSGQITAIQALNTVQTGQISALQGDVANLFDARKEDRKDARKGIAAAMALPTAPMPSTPGGIGYAVNAATFRGEYAAGASLNYRLNTGTPTAINVGIAVGGNKNNGARVGISGEF